MSLFVKPLQLPIAGSVTVEIPMNAQLDRPQAIVQPAGNNQQKVSMFIFVLAEETMPITERTFQVVDAADELMQIFNKERMFLGSVISPLGIKHVFELVSIQ